MPYATLAGSILLIVLYLSNRLVFDSLCFDRSAILSGEWWRVISAHLIHTDAMHLSLNVGGLLLLGTLGERRDRVEFFKLFLPAALIISAVMLTSSEVARYCGLSGILNTWFVLVLYQIWRARPSPLLIVIAGLYCLKLISEVLAGDSLFVTNDWPSLPLAHLSGMLVGLSWIAWPKRGPSARPTRNAT